MTTWAQRVTPIPNTESIFVADEIKSNELQIIIGIISFHITSIPLTKKKNTCIDVGSFFFSIFWEEMKQAHTYRHDSHIDAWNKLKPKLYRHIHNKMMNEKGTAAAAAAAAYAIQFNQFATEIYL